MQIHITIPKGLLAVALCTLAACSDSSGPEEVECPEALLQFAPATGDTVTAAQGLQYIEIEVGSGTAAAQGHTVDVNYSGYLLTGPQFDTSCGTPAFRLTLGAQEVIDGFDLGIRGMQPGGIRRVIVPPSLGYGNVQNGPIPPNSTLVFDIQLVGIVD
jgi:FKBP-type peptidyl-prolyl cis-trans isomerase